MTKNKKKNHKSKKQKEYIYRKKRKRQPNNTEKTKKIVCKQCKKTNLAFGSFQKSLEFLFYHCLHYYMLYYITYASTLYDDLNKIAERYACV